MRHEVGSRKTPQKLIEFVQDFRLRCYRNLRAASVGLAQKSAGVQKLVGNVEMEWDFGHARFFKAGSVFLAGLSTFGPDLAASPIATWLIK